MGKHSFVLTCLWTTLSLHIKTAETSSERPHPLSEHLFVAKSDLDVRAGLLKQREKQLENCGESLTIMCVGESGTGKSTLISNIFTAPINRHPEARLSGPTVSIVESQMLLDCEGILLKITVIDTPGYGDDVDLAKSFHRIGDYIDGCFEHAMAWEKASDRSCRPQTGGRPELGVDAVLYFIAPHRIKGIDIQFLRHIQGRATIIPIIAKADTLTTQELAEFRVAVSRALSEAGISYFRGPFAVIASPYRETSRFVFPLGQSTSPHPSVEQAVVGAAVQSSSAGEAGEETAASALTAAVEAVGTTSILVCIAESVEAENEGIVFCTVYQLTKFQPQRGRQYPWGFASCEDAGHSDLAALRRCLLTEGLTELKSATELHYEAFRRCRRRRWTAKLPGIGWLCKTLTLPLRVAALWIICSAIAGVPSMIGLNPALPENFSSLSGDRSPGKVRTDASTNPEKIAGKPTGQNAVKPSKPGRRWNWWVAAPLNKDPEEDQDESA